MTGMKEGAGEDPFADDTSGSVDDMVPDASQDSDTTPESASETTSSEETTREPMRIPYKYRRDSVQDGRERVPLFLQSDTKDGEHDARRELEDRFGDDVSLTDLREALVMIGLDHLDEVENKLEEWGYGMNFD
ncbi:hypothetical protein [Halorientalis persicus]|nr:hypothetical protein [Halorientalis persicus]